MGITLVFPGNHHQYNAWVGRTLREQPVADTVYREVLREEQLRGVSAAQVDHVVLVGAYDENRAWDSDPYRMLMHEGFALNKDWARDPVEDWRRAQNPVTAENMDAARRRLEALEAELEED